MEMLGNSTFSSGSPEQSETGEKVKHSPSTSGTRSLAQRLWGIDWGRHFPVALGVSGVLARPSNFRHAKPFLPRWLGQTYAHEASQTSFLFAEGHPSKEFFYEELADTFLFFENSAAEDPIGFFVGNAQDWSTYYLRYVVIDPVFRKKQVFHDFLVAVFSILQLYPVERIEADVAPSNLSQIHLLNKLQMNVSGTTVSERWGTLVKFTKYLSPRHEAVFLNSLCFGPKPQQKNG